MNSLKNDSSLTADPCVLKALNSLLHQMSSTVFPTKFLNKRSNLLFNIFLNKIHKFTISSWPPFKCDKTTISTQEKMTH